MKLSKRTAEKKDYRKDYKRDYKKDLYDTISFGLELKFGDKSSKLMKKVTKIKSIEKLGLIKDTIRIADKLEDIEKLL
jgi:hypothetical protein